MHCNEEMLKFSDFINRLRHNRGFGVQSPSAFFFVTQVLKEQLPYYAYKDIDRIARRSGTHSKKKCRRLFRIANYLYPKSIIAIGEEAATPLCALAAAVTTAKITHITSKPVTATAAEEYLTGRINKRLCGDARELLQEHLKENTTLQLLFIGNDCDITSTLQTALQHADERTAIIADGIHRNPERLKQWQEAVENPRTIVTYDLYSMGLLLFDNKKQKQHYTLLM